MKIKIIKASPDLIRKNISLLVEIDNLYFNKNAWNKDNFLYPLNKKFELSKLILFENNIVGYGIASMKENVIHIHRYVIKEDFKKLKMGTKMMLEFLKENKNISLKVEISNTVAINFYNKMNFKIINQEGNYYNLLLKHK